MADATSLTRTLVTLADTLVDDFDLIQFLQLLTRRCADLLGCTDAGVALTDDIGRLHMLASSSERMRLIELIELQSKDGPCLDAWRSGVPVRSNRLQDDLDRWPSFAPAALAAGYQSVYAVPLRLRDRRLGALNLFGNEPNSLSQQDHDLSQAMADVATIGILQERLLREQTDLSTQLRGALTTRISLEQAKGVIAQQAQIDVDDAFTMIRDHARRSNRKIADLAADIVARRLSHQDLQGGSAPSDP
jgi:transcriptional regulator with GAF, ATPase, and Fis domain